MLSYFIYKLNYKEKKMHIFTHHFYLELTDFSAPICFFFPRTKEKFHLAHIVNQIVNTLLNEKCY